MTVEKTNKKSEVVKPTAQAQSPSPKSQPEPGNEAEDAFYSPENSLLEIDAISQRITELSNTLQTPAPNTQWQEANNRIIEFRAELERLQNDLQTHHRQDTKPRIEHEILNSLGQQMEMLAKQVRLSTEQSDRTYEGHLGCIHAVLKELKADIEALKTRSTDTSATDNTTEQITALGQLLVEEFNKLGSGHGTGQAIDQLSEKISGLENRFDEGLRRFLEESEDSNSVVEMSCKIDALMTMLENRTPSPSATEVDYRHQIDALTERVAKTQSTLEILVNSINRKLPTVTQQDAKAARQPAATVPPATASVPTAAAPTVAPASPSWEQQKKALLEGYGFESPETEPQTPTQTPAVQAATPDNNPEDRPVSIPDPLPEAEIESTPELEDLKTQLEEKLRRAEIEISIERAKIHQERRELETIQHDINQQQAKIESHSGEPDNDKGDNEEGGRRWSRFLGN